MILERDVYVAPPVEAGESFDIVWKLNRCLYGLNDGARQFYLSVREHLITLGCVPSHLDPAMFIFLVKEKLQVAMLMTFCMQGVNYLIV